MADYFLVLGSNLGSRAAVLARARRALSRLPGGRLKSASRIYESRPQPAGAGAGGPYLNQAIRLGVSLSPMGLLAEAKLLEAEAGRRPGKRWGPRPLDVDIICRGSLRLRTPWLTLPHPRLAGRAFVLAPLAEIHSGRLPGGGTARSLLKRLKGPSGTVKIHDPGRRHGR